MLKEQDTAPKSAAVINTVVVANAPRSFGPTIESHMKILTMIYFLLSLTSLAQGITNFVTVGEKHTLQSKILSEERPYWVNLPERYFSSRYSPAKYPVIYILDGQWAFQGATTIITELRQVGFIPEAIVIGVVNPTNISRTKDFTPTNSIKGFDGVTWPEDSLSGGGPNFIKFLREELMPHINKSYRTMSYNVLIGHSLGGLATINTLQTDPNLFNAYISIDPSLAWDNKILVRRMHDFLRKSDLKDKQLFVAQANDLHYDSPTLTESFSSLKEFVKVLELETNSGLNWHYKYYDDEAHMSVPTPAIRDGLRYVFNDYFFNVGINVEQPEKIVEHFKNFSKKSNVIFNPPEYLLNETGYFILRNLKNYDLALRYFKLNIEIYPLSANTYDSMGDALLTKGDKEKSIEYFKKSIELNPSNDNVRIKLEKLKQLK